MALRTVEQYRESLKDGRIVYYQGEQIEDVTSHPAFRVLVDTMAIDYVMANDPQYRDLSAVYDEELGEEISRHYHSPRNGDDLLKEFELIVKSTELADGYIPFSHDIGADSLNALRITANTLGKREYVERIEAYGRHIKTNDLAVVAAVTDVKGNRLLRPSDPQQSHPDFYVRMVDQNDRGIVVRGAKAHITGAAYANEFFALPCRVMTESDKDYAVAFALPVNTPGITQVARPFHAFISPLEFPTNRPVRMHTDSLIIFDDVLVPWERVFLCGEWRQTATLVHNFALLHRRTGCAYRIPMSEQLLGVAQGIAECNGVANVPHVREKITEVVIYLETLKALSRSACLDYVVHGGVAVPNPMTTNIAKYHFAHHYHEIVKIIEDLAGGLLATAPSYRDYRVPALTDHIRKYLGGPAGLSAEHRLRMFDITRRLTRQELETMVLHGEGSPQAERMVVYAEAKKVIDDCKALAYRLAGIEE